MSYHAKLMLRLAGGAASLSEDLRLRHGEWLAAAQRDDGGFAGRRGPSDPYYTGFALRSLALVGRLSGSTVRRAGEFLAGCFHRPLSGPDFTSLLSGITLLGIAGGDRQRMALNVFEPLRRPDGGYAKTVRSGQSGTHQTFLAAICREMAGLPPADSQAAAALIRRRRRPDGGFVEFDAMRHSGVNPTAAALAILRLGDALDEPTCAEAIRFLASMQAGDGGFRAHGRIPAGDLLSTFSALAALADLDAFDAIDLGAAHRFALSLASPGGGFRAGSGTLSPTFEYTFYGLGAIALR